MTTTCYISAPFGLDLGELPSLLVSRQISWDWNSDRLNFAQAIRQADIFIGVLNHTRADYRVVHEAGIAAGLDKSILLILTPALKIPIDLTWYSIARVPLSERKALGFHLDAFLARPKQSIFDDRKGSLIAAPEPPGKLQREDGRPVTFESELERKLCAVLDEHGVSYVAQPDIEGAKRFRPDLLVWLGSQDPELLDPSVIEVKRSVERGRMHEVEQQLMGFMTAAGARSGIIVTEEPAPKRKQQGWPNIFWLDLTTISNLVANSQLGDHLRELRNRAAHRSR